MHVNANELPRINTGKNATSRPRSVGILLFQAFNCRFLGTIRQSWLKNHNPLSPIKSAYYK